MRGSFSSTLLLFALGAACAGEPAVEKRAGEIRVALLTPGPISDQAWNGEANRSLIAIRDGLGASISHIQTRTPASFDENFREYGRQSYDLVIGHGFEYKDAAERIAPAFPRTVFLVTSSEVSGTNVAGVRFSFAQPAYLAGIAAAGASKTGTIGNERLRDRLDGATQQRLDSVADIMAAGRWQSPVSWTSPRQTP